LVLVDPSQEAFNDWMKSNRIRPSENEQAQIAKASQGVRDENAAVPTYYEAARASKLPAGIPVVLLTAMKDDSVSAEARKVWVEKHAEWIAKVPGGKQIKVESGHFIQSEQPKVVVDAIREVVELAKKR
jgi:pimeloyl-ACP methyl ester carboxylesterase